MTCFCSIEVEVAMIRNLSMLLVLLSAYSIYWYGCYICSLAQ